MKRFICFLLACLMITSSLCIFPLAAENETEETAYAATLEMAYGGATGIFSMTFDDGDIATARWLNEVFEQYDLYGSTMNITAKNFANDELVATWQDILSAGRLESESHTKTHMPLPAQWWSNYEKYAANNTEENYESEIVGSYNRILEVTGRAPLTLAASNNTMHDDAVKKVSEHYYALRQGMRWNLNTGLYQSLDPVVGITYTQHADNNIAQGAGGWYNPYMMSFASDNIKGGLDIAANEGYWLITMCHDIGESGDVTKEVAISFFEHAAKLRDEGKLWVTTFGTATKYIRERQNSTVSAKMTEEGLVVNVLMADTTADNLPLPADIFNHPLTVKVEVPSGYAGVTYTVAGERKYTDVFTDEGKTYTFVDVVPNSGDILLTPFDIGSDDGIIPNVLGTINNDGTFSSDTSLVQGGTVMLDVASRNKVYAKIDLESFKEYNTASVVLDVTENVSGVISVYGIQDKSLINGWDATSITPFNAPANDRHGASVDLERVFGSGPIGSISVTGAMKYSLNITSYVLDLLERNITAGTLIFVLEEDSASDNISFTFSTNNLFSKTIDYDSQSELLYTTSSSTTAGKDVYYTGNLTAEKLTLASDDTQTNALKVNISSKWNLFKILNVFPETMTSADIGRKFTITFKMKETDNTTNTSPLGIRMGMVGTHTGGPLCGNVGGGSADNKGTQYNSVIVKNTAFDTWETITYEFEVTQEFLTGGSTVAQQIGFFGNWGTVRTLWFDDFVVEEVKVDQGESADENLFSSMQDFESTTNLYDNFTKLGFGLFQIDSTMNATPSDSATKAMVFESVGGTYERIYYYGASPNSKTDNTGTYTTDDIGRTFRVSFKVNTPAKTTLRMAMVHYENVQYSALDSTHQKASVSISEEQAGTWVKVEYTYTVTEDFLNEAGHYTEFLIAMGSCSGANSTNKAKIYLDDFKTIEIPDTAEDTVFMPTAAVTVGTENTEGLNVSLSDIAPDATHKHAYISFDKDELASVRDGKLSFEIANGMSETLRVLALREDLLGKLTPEDRYLALSSAQIDTKYIWRVLDVAEIVAQDGTYTVDVGTYLREMENYGASFLIVQRDVLDTQYYRLDLASVKLSANTDYTTDGTVTVNDGTLTVDGSTLTLSYLLDNDSENIAKAGVTYYARIKASAGVKVSFLGSEGQVDEEGNLVLSVTPLSDVENPTVTLSSENGFTVSEVIVDTDVTHANLVNASLALTYATDSDYLNQIMQNISLETSIRLNFYLPADVPLISVTDETGKNLLDENALEEINGNAYYVISASVASKDAYKASTLTVTPLIGRAFVLDGSIIRYANRLLALNQTSDYIGDSQSLVGYILNYIRESALALDGANAEDLVEFDKGIALDKTLDETVYPEEDFVGVDAFCLDLESYIGMVFKVENGFVGTISANLPGVPEVSAAYTADAPADEDALLIISDIPAYALRGTITLVVTPDGGDSVEYQCNLATYVSRMDSSLLYSVYMYAKEASAYVKKYPVVDIVK